MSGAAVSHFEQSDQGVTVLETLLLEVKNTHLKCGMWVKRLLQQAFKCSEGNKSWNPLWKKKHTCGQGHGLCSYLWPAPERHHTSPGVRVYTTGTGKVDKSRVEKVGLFGQSYSQSYSHSPEGCNDHCWTRTKQIIPGLPCGCRGPNACSILSCFPRHVSKELDQKVEQLGLKLAPKWNASTAGSCLTSHNTAPASLCILRQKNGLLNIYNTN